MKTARFAQVVARSGTPEPYTLWLAPEQDRDLQRALKQHRVMTVHRANVGAKKDYGEVGFTADRESTLLLFPKSLKVFEGKRIVGVNYDLLAPVPAETRAPAKRKTPAAKPKPALETPASAEPRYGEFKIVRREEDEERESSAPAPARTKRPRSFKRPKASKPAKVANSKPEPKLPKPVTKKSAPSVDALRQEIGRAMKQLKSGKAVAAYQTLEQALAE